jgi:hypothetical protein
VTDNRKSGRVGAPSTSSASNGDGDGGGGDKADVTVEAAPPANKKPAAETPEKSSEAAAAS